MNYKKELIIRFWAYQASVFPNWKEYFDRPYASDVHPPVFHKDKVWKNVIVRPGAGQEEVHRLFSQLKGVRHKWFRSMNSSQALALSVLGNLAIYGHLNHLAEIKCDNGLPLLGEELPGDFTMEYEVNYLGEPRSTRLDALLDGNYQVAIECKFTETEVGSCSRPRLRPKDSNYSTAFCDGNFTKQRGRKEKCSLTEIGVLYWKYVPAVFKWRNDIEHRPCPLYKNYQLVRNVLAACVQPGGSVSLNHAHALVFYDQRNPAFQKGGDGFTAFEKTRQALKVPSLLRKCSWQSILTHIRKEGILPWLTEELNLKYGL